MQRSIILFSCFVLFSLNDAVLVVSSPLSAHKLMFLMILASIEFELSYCFLNQSPSALSVNINNHKYAQSQHTDVFVRFVFLH